MSNFTKRPTSLLRLYLILAAAMMLYKGSQMMFHTTINTLLFRRIFHNEKKTDFSTMTRSENSSVVMHVCYPNHTVKEDKDSAQEKSDKFQTYLLSVASLLSLVTLIFYGSLSDYIGRKLILIVCVVAYIFQTFIVLVIIFFNVHHSYLFIAYIVDGLGGSAFGFSLGCFLCVADVAEHKKDKALGLALIESLNAIGSITTKFSTSYFVKRDGFLYPVLASSVGCVCVFFLLVLALDETANLSHSDNGTRHTGCCKQIPSARTLFNNLTNFYFGNIFKDKRKLFRYCFVVFFLVESPMIFRSDLIPLLQVGWPFCWTSLMANTYTFVGLALNYIVAMVLLKYLQSCISESYLIIMGIMSSMAFNILTGMAHNRIHLYLGLFAGTLMIMPKPIIRSIASKAAGPKKQGALFAGLIASELVCEITSDVVYTFVYSHNYEHIDGTIFLIIAAFLLISLVLVIVLKRTNRTMENTCELQDNDRRNIAINDTENAA